MQRGTLPRHVLLIILNENTRSEIVRFAHFRRVYYDVWNKIDRMEQNKIVNNSGNIYPCFPYWDMFTKNN
jgi:hypothetical protein